MKITTKGVYRDVSSNDYFSDPCPSPSLSQSVAKILIEQSPLHAYYAHPRLGEPLADEDDGEKYDKAKAIGNAAHAIMLGRGKVLEVGDFDNWRKKEAQEFKAEALAAGKEPILAKHYSTAMNMVESALEQLNRIHGCKNAFTYGDAEVVIASCEHDLWLRAMVDWITPDAREIWDYKTSGMSASPYNTGKQMASGGWHIQAAMHERILDAIDPKTAGRRRHFFVCQENEPPYALTVNEIAEAPMTIGRKQIDYAVTAWGHCLAKSEWPGYPLRIIHPELPVWAESGWLQREESELSEAEDRVKNRLDSLMGG